MIEPTSESNVVQFDQRKRSVEETLRDAAQFGFDQVILVGHKDGSWFTWSSVIRDGRLFSTLGALDMAKRDVRDCISESRKE